MKIWIFNQYGMLPEHGPMSRTHQFTKHLNRRGCEATAFVASHPHNSKFQLIEGREKFAVYKDCDFPWVLVKTCNYEDGGPLRGPRRIWSIIQYFFNLFAAAKHFEKPECIIGSSAPPFTALAAVILARRYKCKSIVEIRDLWPESIVDYGVASKNNPIVKLLYKLEKWLYTNADAVIFTIEGGRDYIIESGWDTGHGGSVDLSKVYHINNGVDIKEFDYNRSTFILDDPDLADPDTFKVVYTGSLRKANNIGLLLDLAKKITLPNVKFLIWGAGNDVEALRQRIVDEGIGNVVIKGHVEKKYIPYINSRADLNVLNYQTTGVMRYGGSQNKLFEYFASGTPVMTNIKLGYDLLERYDCGFHADYSDIDGVSRQLEALMTMPREEYEKLCANARRAAEDYDFNVLTDKLLAVLNGLLYEN